MVVFMKRKKVFMVFILVIIGVFGSFLILKKSYHKKLLVDSSNQRTLKAQQNAHAKILCLIITTQSQLKYKARAVHRTWAQECDKHLFIVKFLNETLDSCVESTNNSLGLPLFQPSNFKSENYEDLTNKVYRTIIDVYKKYNSYDWYLKADDDTYVCMDNLREFLRDKNPSEPGFFGCQMKLTDDYTYNSGGAGYVLSKEALNRLGARLAGDFRDCPNQGREDGDLGSCLDMVKVYPNLTIDENGRERFHPINLEAYFLPGAYPEWMYKLLKHRPKKGADGISETSITFHYIWHDVMSILHQSWKRYRNSKRRNKTRNDFIRMLEGTLL